MERVTIEQEETKYLVTYKQLSDNWWNWYNKSGVPANLRAYTERDLAPYAVKPSKLRVLWLKIKSVRLTWRK